MLNYEGGGWLTAWVQIRSCAFKICNNEARQMLKLKHDQLEHKIWQFYNRYSNVITSTNTYCRCDRIVWQIERFDSLNDLTAWMLWQLECFDSLNALTAWQLDSLTAWQLDSLTAWQLDSLTAWRLDGLTALTARLQWQLDCNDSLTYKLLKFKLVTDRRARR